jgi:hypothetical protein
MEHRAVVGAVANVLQEILGGERGARGVDLDDEVAGRSLEPHSRRRRGRRLCKGCERDQDDEQVRGHARHGFHLRAILAYLRREAPSPIP